MKKTSFLLFTLISIPLTCFLQIIPNNNFSDFETITCPYDSTVTITQPKNWRIYQTLNNKWDGPADSTICINAENDGQNNAVMDLGAIDPNKSIFVRGLVDFTPNQGLMSDWIYQAIGNIQYPPDVQFKTSTDCPNNVCSGLIIGIEIPDSNFIGTNTRFYFDIPSTNHWYGDFETCVPTEFFFQNTLREFIFKLTLEAPSIDLNGKILEIQNAQLSDWVFPEIVPAVIAAPNTGGGTTFSVSLNEISNTYFNDNFLFKYWNPSVYPSPDNIYYTEAVPEPNTTEQSEIFVTVDNYSSVVFQPFTGLRGGLVEGSNTVRHTANLVSNGGDICLEQFIELVFDDGSKLIYNGGHINFEGTSACLMFQNKGALVVGENQTLYYGQNGKGILAWMPGGEIRLEKNSELVIDNTLWIFGLEDREYPPVFNIYLEPGNTLAFGENAYLVNHFSTAPNTQLNVYMNGGVLDDRKLNTSSRNLINRIYPKSAERFADNITVYENPVESDFNFAVIMEEAGKLNLELFDMNGRIILKGKLAVEQGINQIKYPLNNLAGGVYAIRLQSGGQYFTTKILKI